MNKEVKVNASVAETFGIIDNIKKGECGKKHRYIVPLNSFLSYKRKCLKELKYQTFDTKVLDSRVSIQMLDKLRKNNNSNIKRNTRFVLERYMLGYIFVICECDTSKLEKNIRSLLGLNNDFILLDSIE